MDSLERNHNALAGTVERVEINQRHAEELNKLRFDALDHSINGIGADLKAFMSRINALISGEVQLPQNTAQLAAWQKWRDEVDAERDQQAVLNGQVKLLGRIAVLIVSTQIVAIVVAIGAAINASGHP